MNLAVFLVVSVLVLAVLRPDGQAAPRRIVAVAGPHELPVIDRIGEQLMSHLPFDPMVSPRALVAMVALVVVSAAVSPPLASVPVIVLIVIEIRRRRRSRVAKSAEISRGLPDFIDLLILVVGSGLTPRLAFVASGPWLGEPFRSVVGEVVRRNDSGEPFAASLEAVASDLGPEARPLVSTLIASETDGAALLPALERIGDEARRRRRVAAEERARRIPVAILFPLVICVLPAFALLTVVPLLVGTLAEVRLPG